MLGQCFPKWVPWPRVTMTMVILDWLLALDIINLKATREPRAQRKLVCKRRLMKQRFTERTVLHRKREFWVLLSLASLTVL